MDDRMDLITEPRQYVNSGGVVAATTGTDAAFDTRASFAALGTELGRYAVNAAGNYLVQTNSATLGTAIKLNLRGQYHVNFTCNCLGAAGPIIVLAGIGLDLAAAQLALDPVITVAGMKAVGRFSAIEVITQSINISGMVIIDDSRIAALGIISIQLSNGAGATPAAADVVDASAGFVITRIADVMGTYA
jgi:hypothetical protein